MNILAVGANPDDIELLCAGTLALYVQRGDTVAMAFITNGDKGSNDIEPGEMADIRREEAGQAAAVIGASVHPLDVPDGQVTVSLDLRRKLVAVIRRIRPDLIFTHHPNDSPAHRCVPPVYFMDTVAGIGVVPEEYVDITQVFETKIEMLSKHQSQLRYMMERDGFDLLDAMMIAVRYRGYQCGVRYAEGFIRHKVYPSLSPGRLLP